MTDEQPVFVDGTGKRRKLLQVAGVISGVVIAGYAIALGVSLGTGAEVPLTTWVVPEKKTNADDEKAKVRPKTAVTTPVPQPPVPVYPTPGGSPSVTVTPTETAAPSPTLTETATARPSIVTKSPKPIPSQSPVTESPSPSATPTATEPPPGDPGPSGSPTAEPPPGQEKKTVEE